jgi:hypothetical protein
MNACRRPGRRSVWVGRWVVLLVLIALSTAASDARAGSYTVSGCRTGWVPDVRNTTGTLGPVAQDLCDTFGVLQAQLGTPYSINNPGDYAGWRFVAPPDTSMSRATIRWQGSGHSANNAILISVLESSLATPPIYHPGSFDGVDTLALSDASWIRVSTRCLEGTPPLTCQPIDPSIYSLVVILSSTVQLVDRLAPVVESVSGPAVADTLWTGSEPLTFSATDRGGGLYRVVVEADGAPVKALPAVADDRCVDRTGARDFAYPVPCPTQGAGSVSIDAADLPSGQHMVAVYLEDAAGNRATLVPPSSRLIVNDYRAVGYYANGAFFNPRFATPRVANGDGAVSGAQVSAGFVRHVGTGRSRHSVRRAVREVRFSQSPTVRGTLTAPSGEPIANATVFIGQQPEGQPWRLDGAVRTDSAGDFVYRPAARHPNRQLRAVYFPFSDSHENASSDPLALRVRAGMTLHVSRHSLRNGQRLVFTGRILGALPAAGIAVTLQAKVGRHYRSFRQLRASSGTGGRIRTAYRFERTTGPVRYRFRLKVVRQAGLPFQSGASPVVAVSVRP